MADDRGVLRQVAWTELFPWLALGRSFRLAIQARLLLLAALGIVLTAGRLGAPWAVCLAISNCRRTGTPNKANGSRLPRGPRRCPALA